MRLACALVAECLLLVAMAASQALSSPSGDAVEHSVTFLRGPDAPGSVSEERVHTCLRLLIRELNLAGEELPHIVVMHASRKAAHAAGVQQTSIRRNGTDREDSYYEFWIVGEPRLADYTVALYNILEKHFDIRLAPSERKQVMLRVFRHLRNTVDARTAQVSPQ